LHAVCRDIHLTPQEEKIARLTLDPAAKTGEIASAAKKLVCSWRNRKITVEQIQNQDPATGQTQVVYQARVIYQDGIVREVPLTQKVGLFCCGVILFFSISTNFILVKALSLPRDTQLLGQTFTPLNASHN
jgi:hypothetical protein